MIKALYFDPITGASGDMILAALFDLGVPVEYVNEHIRSTGINEYELHFKRITDHNGFACGHCEVITGESHHHRALPDIEVIIDSGDFPAKVKKNAKNIFRRLAEAESRVHNISIDKVHFHEVGAIDAIVDILGAALSIDYLQPDKIFCGPLKIGRGTVMCAHGEIPVPAPATVELIKGFPVIPLPIDMELTTPTGAAILTTLSEGDNIGQAMVIIRTGYGKGTRELKGRPNVFRVMEAEIKEDTTSDEVDIIETDIDDDSPEVTASLMDKLRIDGVCDITLQQIIMKKGRPGYRLTVIADKWKSGEIARLLFTHSSTIGVRVTSAGRLVLPRSSVKVKTKWGIITAKRIERPDRIEIVPEYEQCRITAEEHGISLREVMQEVIRNA